MAKKQAVHRTFLASFFLVEKSTKLIMFILYSNMMSFIGYINNTMIKISIYLNSHMHIDEQIINIIPK